jgi:hypothetical protein
MAPTMRMATPTQRVVRPQQNANPIVRNGSQGLGRQLGVGAQTQTQTQDTTTSIEDNRAVYDLGDSQQVVDTGRQSTLTTTLGNVRIKGDIFGSTNENESSQLTSTTNAERATTAEDSLPTLAEPESSLGALTLSRNDGELAAMADINKPNGIDGTEGNEGNTGKVTLNPSSINTRDDFENFLRDNNLVIFEKNDGSTVDLTSAISNLKNASTEADIITHLITILSNIASKLDLEETSIKPTANALAA